MNTEKYVRKNQIIVDMWKNRFDCLFYWDIKFVYDGEHWSQTLYDVKNQKAIIYPCDIQDEEDYLVHEILKLCFISCENDMTKKLDLIKDIVAIVRN
jgi:hypothetical protein